MVNIVATLPLGVLGNKSVVQGTNSCVSRRTGRENVDSAKQDMHERRAV